jgi:hypothetical protein
MEKKLLNLKWFLSLEINQKLKFDFPQINASSSNCHLNSHLFLCITWGNALSFPCHGEMHEESPIDHLNQSMHLHVTWRNAFASMSWRNAWGLSHWPSYWPSSHLAISTNHASSCDMRKSICFFMSWGNTLKISHLAISSNQCLFISHEKNICLFISWKNVWRIFHWSSYLPFHLGSTLLCTTGDND